MNNQEAVERLKEHISAIMIYVTEAKLDEEEVENELLNIEAINMAIEALSAERTGEWINTGVLTVHCSNCKSEFHELEAMNFCPNCGARMKGGDDE